MRAISSYGGAAQVRLRSSAQSHTRRAPCSVRPHSARGGARTQFFCLGVLAVAVVATAAPDARLLPSPTPALKLFRNSHATAAAWLVKHYGLGRSNESDKTLVATAWVYTRQCGDCSNPDSVTWPPAEGLAKMVKARGAAISPTESCTRPADAKSPATFSQLTSAIDAGRPVLVTFCYDPRAAKSPEAARGRARDCLQTPPPHSCIM